MPNAQTPLGGIPKPQPFSPHKNNLVDVRGRGLICTTIFTHGIHAIVKTLRIAIVKTLRLQI